MSWSAVLSLLLVTDGALRAQDPAALDAELLAAVQAEKGDPLEVLARMRAAANDPTHDLIYLLLAGSEGRKNDKAEAKACAERFDAAWKERQTSGLDVEAMKQRLDALGLKKACEDLGLTFDPGALRKLDKAAAEAMLPSRKGAEALQSAAKLALAKAEREVDSTSQSLAGAESRIRIEKERIAEARNKLRLEGNERERIRLKQRILDCEPRLDQAERDRERGTTRLRGAEARRDAAAADLRRLQRRLDRLYPS